MTEVCTSDKIFIMIPNEIALTLGLIKDIKEKGAKITLHDVDSVTLRKMSSLCEMLHHLSANQEPKVSYFGIRTVREWFCYSCFTTIERLQLFEAVKSLKIPLLVGTCQAALFEHIR